MKRFSRQARNGLLPTAFALTAILSTTVPAFSQSALPLEAYGVWDSNDGSDFDPASPAYDYLRGHTMDLKWKDIQPDNDSTYNWDLVQQSIDRAVSRGKYLFLGISVGPDAPDWIYANGVPAVTTTGAKQSWTRYPYYLNENYKKFYFGFIRAMGKFIENQPEQNRKYLGFVQVKTGCTGDECAYKGDVTDPQYDLPNDKLGGPWQDFRMESFGVYRDAFTKVAHPVPLLFNNIEFEDYPNAWKWVMDSIGTGFGFKGSAYVRGHHLSDELSFTNSWKKYTIDPQGLTLFSRAEMDQTWTKPYYSLNNKLGFYWGAISGLNSGLCVWNISKGALQEAETNSSFQETFRFFNRYADQVYPATATRAFIVLHEGLNSADTVKFPESKYGKASQSNLDRYTAICSDPIYSTRGAKMDDLASAALGQVAQRDGQTGFNDAGWDIWPTNYSRFISQIDPDNESIGLFRIGGTITTDSPIYSRFARGFDHANGKDGMYFKLDDKFYSSAAGKVKMVVTWYDSIAGSTWDLKYDGGAGDLKTAKSFTGTGSREWIRDTIEIIDAVMLHNGPNGSDFALVNTDSNDDIFHGIEFERGEQPVVVGQPNHTVRPSVTIAGSTITLSSQFDGKTKTVKLLGLNGRVIFEQSFAGSSFVIPSGVAKGVNICSVSIDGNMIFSSKLIR